MTTETLLVEIGTEELPPTALKNLGTSFARCIADLLAEEGFSFASCRPLFTPRRLAVMVADLNGNQPDRLVERKGPALQAAYDDAGNATKAALGFAKSCGVSVDELERVDTEKGTWLYFNANEPGKNIKELAVDIIEKALNQLPIPKPMRWGNSDTEFIRPIHWVVLMYGAEIIAGTIKNLATGNTSYGHRFHAPEPIHLAHANDYESALQTAKVTVDFELRKTTIQNQLNDAASTFDAVLNYEESLLEEVTNLVELATPIVGEFSSSFLAIPQEVLVATMQEAQRYFPLYTQSEQKLLPRFIIISNIESKNPETIKKGNERVIKPRFEDAAFFWQRDKSKRLDSRVAKLADVLFEKQLGSLLDKSLRIQHLAERLAGELDLDTGLARRAATLCKCDLLTEMVNEFPKLQGIMGRYYAEHDSEPSQVSMAIQEHYQPIQAGSAIPSGDIGKVIAICDRVDTLVGIFATGKKPTGIKDPYALRRAALGIIRIAIEGRFDFDLPALLDYALNLLPQTLFNNEVSGEVENFIIERLRGYLGDAAYQTDTLDAVRSVRPASLMDFHQRVQAVHEFRQLPEAASLAAANKRIRNILKKINASPNTRIDDRLLGEGAERNLFDQLQVMEESVAPVIAGGEYSKALTTLATLKSTIDAFFDDVMVMDDAEDIRNNRIALVARVSNQFSAIADISCLQS